MRGDNHLNLGELEEPEERDPDPNDWLAIEADADFPPTVASLRDAMGLRDPQNT